MRALKFSLASICLLFASMAFGQEKYLITMPGPKPAIAKSFKSLGAGKYEFTIDSSKKLQGNAPVTFDILKASLVKKSFIKSVTGDAKKIVVTYEKLDEAKFLEKVSKARISGGAESVDLAMEGSVSSGSVRARTAIRDPGNGEVRGKILNITGTQMKVMAQAKGKKGVPADFPLMRPITVDAKGFTGKAGQMFYFKPGKTNGKVWTGSEFKAE